MKVMLIGFWCLWCASSGWAQQAEWTLYPSLREVRDVVSSGDALWGASPGAVFSFVQGAPEPFRIYTPTDGLQGNRPRALMWNPADQTLWIGHEGGLIDVLEPATGTVNTLHDVARATRFDTRDVRRMRRSGNRLLVSTSFGVVVYDLTEQIVRESYTRVASLNAGLAANDALETRLDGMQVILMATAEGIALAERDGRNLQDPASWRMLNSGLLSRVVYQLEARDGTLFAATESGLMRWTGTSWQLMGPGQSVRVLGVSGSTLLAIGAQNVVRVNAQDEIEVFSRDGLLDPSALLARPQGFWVADRQRALVPLTLSGSSLQVGSPVQAPGPDDALFTAMTFQPDGTLWATGTGVQAGFYRRSSEGVWTSFTPANTPQLLPRLGLSLSAVHADAQGTVWVGGSGDGLFSIAPAGTITRFGRQNSSLLASGGGEGSFMIVEGVASEASGTLWVTNKVASSPLHVRTTNGQWTALPTFRSGGMSPQFTTFAKLIVDSFGTKWIIVQDETILRFGRGVAVYESGANPTATTDDHVRLLGTDARAGQGLPSLNVRDLVEDRDGRIWAGTDAGPAYYLNNGVAARDPQGTFIWPVDRENEVYLMRGLRVNALAVDLGNGIWMGTPEGVWLVRDAPQGGFRVEAQYTTANSPLPSNAILALAVSPTTGDIFISTDAGLVSFAGGVRAPSAEAGDLFVYPNPYRPEDAGRLVQIEGLVEQAQVRIVTPDGTLVRQFDTRGGSIQWDTRDAHGQLVPSGLYVVLAYGIAGEGTGYGRIAIIR